MGLSSSSYQLDMMILKVFFNVDGSMVLKKKEKNTTACYTTVFQKELYITYSFVILNFRCLLI